MRKSAEIINKQILTTMRRTQTNDYQAPNIDVMELEVERGFSASYGDYGEPGQDSGYNDYEEDL